MKQINLRIDEQLDEILSYLAERRNLSKSTIAKEILTHNFVSMILPILLEDYGKGLISVKKIIALSGLPPTHVMDLLAEQTIEPPISQEIDQYTKRVADRLAQKWKK